MPDVVIEASDVDVAWIAGVLEGEGSFAVMHYKTHGYRKDHPGYPKIVMNLTDEDIVRRCKKITGVGIIHRSHPPSRARHKPTWIWSVNRGPEALALMRLILPHMGIRRSEKIRSILTEFAHVIIQPYRGRRDGIGSMDK